LRSSSGATIVLFATIVFFLAIGTKQLFSFIAQRA
jgi:hypothetical protein